jgi:hypothetical protein
VDVHKDETSLRPARLTSRLNARLIGSISGRLHIVAGRFASPRAPSHGSYKNLSFYLLIFLCVMVLGALSAGFLARGHSRPAEAVGRVIDPGSLELVRAEPIVFSPESRLAFAIPEDDLTRILRLVEPFSSGLTSSLCVHILSAHGLDAKFEHNPIASNRELLKVFTDDAIGRARLGSPPMVRTRHGVCANASTGSSKERHYDQTLACLAQLGLPLSTPIRVGAETLSLRDVLRDSIACFELRQSEMEWTAIAYASYLPPHRSWMNKFGETYTFDQLADEILSRDPGKASCCGCHLVDALLLLHRINREVAGFLSSEVDRRITDRLGEIVRAARSSQHPDGHWGPAWNRGLASGSETRGPAPESILPGDQLLATSHITHWMMDLPEGFRVPESVLLRAASWIHANLKEATPEFVRQNFCPCSHGAWVLRMISTASAGSPTEPDPSSPKPKDTSTGRGATPRPHPVSREGGDLGQCVVGPMLSVDGGRFVHLRKPIP